jgi:phosphate transport system substrate-binding protein
MMTTSLLAHTALAAIIGFTGIANDPAPSCAAPTTGTTVTLDGSSTVFSISEAVTEESQQAHKGIGITVGVSGTGEGCKKFVAGSSSITQR